MRAIGRTVIAAGSGETADPDRIVLRLFVAGVAPSSALAASRIRGLCERHLGDRYDLEIIDVYQEPGRAARDDVYAIPTLLRDLPGPPYRIAGDLRDEGRVLRALAIKPRE